MAILEDKEHIRSPRIREFEGLRGCLAWWVVLFHVYQDAGISLASLPKYELFFSQGWIGVDLFIILSGYVIFLLLETQRETFGVYITRRFFRIAPLYYTMCAWGVLEALWKGLYGKSLLAQIGLHLTMLHGLVPDEILPGSANALNYQAWSISVEWQFYLVAPLLLALIRGSAGRALVILLLCMIGSTVLQSRYHFPFAATVFMRAGDFAIGIASFYLTRLVSRNIELARPYVPFLLPAGIATLWVAGSNIIGPLPIWILVLTAVLSNIAGTESVITRPVRKFLDWNVIVWLGTLSYSTYLSHHLVLKLLTTVLGGWLEPMTPRSRWFVLIGLGFPMILGLSAALYHFVEKPGMAWGKKITSRIGQPPIPHPASSAELVDEKA